MQEIISEFLPQINEIENIWAKIKTAEKEAHEAQDRLANNMRDFVFQKYKIKFNSVFQFQNEYFNHAVIRAVRIFPPFDTIMIDYTKLLGDNPPQPATTELNLFLKYYTFKYIKW